ncbi:uncharacterized protein LOC121871712 [Homarus americanus]|uniref:uncharacterized protein LOC121871712 n=1 Tax=Homarus americanus TaxID=6706 RepID=UPI001C4965C0|nr:uncharacterized protein LOC121871712 [Homarus americanus]
MTWTPEVPIQYSKPRIDGFLALQPSHTQSHDYAHDNLLIGTSGMVSKSDHNLKLTDDLRIVNPRIKHSLSVVEPSGLVTAEGNPIQFTKPSVTIQFDGPSGYLRSNGTLFHKP